MHYEYPYPNVELMKRLNIKILLMVIFLISTIFILTFNLSAQEREKKRGDQVYISYEKMRSKFSKGDVVKDYVINGEDIIKIIKKTDFEIKIESSIIEGGLDFTELAESLEKEYLPKEWDEKEKEAFIATKSRYLKNIPIVKNKIEIINSEIRPKKRTSNSINTRYTLFLESINFRRTIFNGTADFLQTTFNGTAYFFMAIFKRDANFSYNVFRGEANFLKATFNGKAEFMRAIYSGEAMFWGTTFNGEAFFWDATFSGRADFMGATFSGRADFRGATFSGRADFLYATFRREADFGRSIFNSGADFGESTFVSGVNFSESTFSGVANFSESTFVSGANFSRSTFIKVAYFRRANFFGILFITHAVFKEYADFQDSKIRRLNYISPVSPTIVKGRIDFRNAMISEAHFQDIIFEKDVDFSNAKFGVPLPLIIAIVRLEKLPQGLEFPASLKDKIHFEAKAKLLIFRGFMTKSEKEELARLSEDSQYRKAVEQLFRESTSGPFAVVFRFVKFESDAYFLRTKFSGDTALESVTFKKEANFTDAEFKGKKEDGKHNFSLSYLNFKNLLIKWDQLPNPKSWVRGTRIKSFIDIEKEERNKKKSKQERKDEKVDEVKKKGKEEVESGEGLEPLSQVLKGLEANFRNQKQLSDANKAYYYKKKAEFKEERNSKAFWTWFPKQTLWSLWWISCGYGTKILWISGWIFFFDLLFAMIYSVRNNLHKTSHPKTMGEFTFKQRLFDFPRLYLREAKPLDMIKSKFTIKFINALRFSSVILLKVGYRDTKISGKILGIDSKYIVWFEWLLGFFLLACLTVTMSNTIPIINSLIKGIF